MISSALSLATATPQQITSNTAVSFLKILKKIENSIYSI